MSMEEAILKLADALLAVAASNHDSAAAMRETNKGYAAAVGAYAQATAAYVNGCPAYEDDITGSSAPGNGANAADTKPKSAANSTDTKPKSTAPKDIEKTADKAPEDTAKKAASGAAEEKATSRGAQSAEMEDDAEVLDYKTDVRPVLLRVIKDKKLGEPAMARVLKEFGVEAANQVAVHDFPALLAKCRALLGEAA